MGNETAHYTHITGGAFELAFRGFQIASGTFYILFRAGYIGSHSSNFGLAFLLYLGKLRSEFLIRSYLLLANRFRATAGLGKLRLSHTDFLLGDFHVAFQVGQSRISLFQLRRHDFVLILLTNQVLLEPRLLRMPNVSKNGQTGKQYHE